MRVFVVVCAALAWTACGARTPLGEQQPPAAGGTPPGLMSCDDGTGQTDCCADGVTESAACSNSGLDCSTPCTQGFRGHYVCSDGMWVAGLGLFPCGAASGGTEACNDGTGNIDCCPAGTASGALCSQADLRCFTHCTGGFRDQFTCSSGTWVAGHGLFPCAADGGTDAGP